ncbi:N-acetylmuramic acid 6-phosphate etherase [Sphingomonas cannabina]|uniref:N-acetylmuramic acid 6-phosphate etherase n=1 Tax=Sphingomonas cannabina TaxID=2899123 RepID=UPI001F359106|nr:N-acetylmuramic acid 6-phosphate etherase [Sphingomonas cannabina]UIJ47163.1 N-acetylmuramic acid 6-phosphate etherase [Sphingomonas cannabina]
MPTETVDPRYTDLDRWPTENAVEAMLEGQIAAVAALKEQTGAIAAAAEAAAARLRAGGRLVYAGAGTSGRVAMQDGVELTPTYSWPGERLVFLIAGGMAALARSVEGAEDNVERACAEVDEAGIGRDDVVVGVAASGRTPYTVAVIEAARRAGALTIGVANNEGAPLLAAAEHPILADTGSEAVAGSTRMKAGTAQKVALNLLSTAIMLRLGRVYRGLMVNMRVSNAKLEARANAIVREAAEVSRERAAAALGEAGNDIALAILIARGMDPAVAADALHVHHGDLRAAIEAGSGAR